MEMQSELKGMADKLVDAAKTNIERDGILAPVFFVGTPKGFGIISPDFSTPESKEASIKRVAALASENNADWIMSISEAWSRVFEKGASIPKGYAPSTDPDRQEVVLFVLNTREHQWFAQAEIMVSVDREGTLKRSFRAPIEWIPADDAQGRLGKFAA